VNERDGGRCGVVVVTMWFVIMFSPCAVCVCVLCRAWKSERVLMRDFFFRKKKKTVLSSIFFLSPQCASW